MDEKRKRLAAAKQKLQHYKREKQKTQEAGIHSHSGTNSCSSSVHNKSEESIASLIADDEENYNQINNDVSESLLNLNNSSDLSSSHSSSLLIDSLPSQNSALNSSQITEISRESPQQQKEIVIETPSPSSVFMLTEQQQHPFENQTTFLAKNPNFIPTVVKVPVPEEQREKQSATASGLTESPLTFSTASSGFRGVEDQSEIVPIQFYANPPSRPVLSSFMGTDAGADTNMSQNQIPKVTSLPPISPTPTTVILQEQEIDLDSKSHIAQNKDTATIKDKITVENSSQCQDQDFGIKVPPKMEEIIDEQESKQLPNYIVDSLQKELSVIRRENAALANRESELLEQLETSEKLMRDLRKEVNQFKQQGNVHQQLEDLQQAVIILSKSKMTIAEELNNEQDKNKELLDNLGTYENELTSLRAENGQLYTEINLLKSKLEEELLKNQSLDDQRRHFSVQVDALQAKLNPANHSSCPDGHSHDHDHDHSHSGESKQKDSHSHEHSHSHSHSDSDCHDHGHGHSHDHGHEHLIPNGHEQHGPGHHNHDHHGAPDHEHDHEGHHHEPHSHPSRGTMEPDTDVQRKLSEMEKTLKRLEWENKTYEAELMRLGPLKHLEPRVLELQTKNAALKEEVDRLDHLVIQLQGENDTIGDYITLYQTQRLALREHAKENDQLVAALAKEKNALLQKLSELNHSVEELARKQSAAQRQNPSNPITQNGSAVLEDKIRNLIVDVNSKVHETYSCSVCSGSRLMTV